MKELFSDTEAGLTDEQIASYERSSGCKFPDDFKLYLREINGGWLTDSADFNFGSGHATGARSLFGFNGASDRDIQTESRERGYLPNWLLPIGDDLGGADLFVMDLRPERAGRIYIRAINAPPNEDNPILSPYLFGDPDQADLYHHVADSFSEFVDMIAGRAAG